MLFILAISLLFVSSAIAQNDLVIQVKSERTMPAGMGISAEQLAKMPPAMQERFKRIGQTEKTVYVRGSQKRTDLVYEKPNGYSMKKVKQTIIDQCDKQQVINFNDDDKKYSVTSYLGSKPASASSSAKGKNGGKITIKLTGTDTGERATLFGYQAKRFKQKISMVPSGDSCMKTPMEMEVDGWYVNLPSYSCSLRSFRSEEPQAGGGCDDEIVAETSGVLPNGVALKETRIIQTESGKITITEEATNVTRSNLGGTFFDVPAGYTPIKGSVSALALPSPTSDMPTSTTQPPANAPQASEQKRTGTIRIGIARPAAEMGKDFNGGDSTEAVSNTLAVALSNPSIETVELETGLPEQEARQKKCDYVIYSKVTRKKGGGMFGSMAPMLAGAAAGMIPGVGGIVASVATSTVMTAATISGGFKSKDEVSFEYRVASADGSIFLPSTTTKQKVKKDGEDVLSPQIAAAGQAFLNKLFPK